MPARKILFIGKVWPEPRSSAAGRRILNLVELFKSANFGIIFSSPSVKSDYSANLSKLGVQEIQLHLNDSEFDEYIGKTNPDVVIFDRFMTEEQFGWRVAEFSPNSLRVLDTEDLHLLRHARQFKEFPHNIRYQNLNLTTEIAKRELASILRSDCSLIISEYEFELLVKYFKISEEQLFYLPFLIGREEINSITEVPSFEQRKQFSWIGNFRHKPNLDAVKFLYSDIWPLIREKLPDAELHIYGAYLPKSIQILHNTEHGFLVEGRAEEVNGVLYKTRILLAPIRFGAGLKGKLIDSMKNGTPSVTTSIGAEGIAGDFSWPGVVEDNAVKFAKSAVELYTNREKWMQAQSDALNLIEKRFDKNLFTQKFLNYLQSKLRTLKKHREKHFLGSLLLHHTMNSSKYMSKWIEEKNKKS